MSSGSTGAVSVVKLAPPTGYRGRVPVAAAARVTLSGLWWTNVFRAPRQVGSIRPSSPRLADWVARQAGDLFHHAARFDVVEIGAGTGALTGALKRAMPNARLTLVEADPACCQYLRRQFPKAEVLEGLVEDLLPRLPAPCRRLVLVSSVPLFSLPQLQRDRVLAVFETLVGQAAKSRVVQYTYVPWLPGRRARQLCGQAVQLVWQNLPPAWVWSSTHRATR